MNMNIASFMIVCVWFYDLLIWFPDEVFYWLTFFLPVTLFSIIILALTPSNMQRQMVHFTLLSNNNQGVSFRTKKQSAKEFMETELPVRDEWCGVREGFYRSAFHYFAQRPSICQCTIFFRWLKEAETMPEKKWKMSDFNDRWTKCNSAQVIGVARQHSINFVIET